DRTVPNVHADRLALVVVQRAVAIAVPGMTAREIVAAPVAAVLAGFLELPDGPVGHGLIKFDARRGGIAIRVLLGELQSVRAAKNTRCPQIIEIGDQRRYPAAGLLLIDVLALNQNIQSLDRTKRDGTLQVFFFPVSVG